LPAGSLSGSKLLEPSQLTIAIESIASRYFRFGVTWLILRPRCNQNAANQEPVMSNEVTKQISRRAVAIAGALGALTISTKAIAAVCPPGKSGTDLMTAGATMPKGVTDKVIGGINLANEKVKLAGYQLRGRELVIQPGGEVPWHSHADRPALIYIAKGTITEFTSTCAVPIVHKAGDLAVEDHKVSHWWRNTGNEPCVVLSFDLFHEGQDAKMM
jgi:quercetin dioxygenase-like cupin family protein